MTNYIDFNTDDTSFYVEEYKKLLNNPRNILDEIQEQLDKEMDKILMKTKGTKLHWKRVNR